MPESLARSTNVREYLAYGWFQPDEMKVDDETYVNHVVGIADEVCECLRAEGFEPDWDGDLSFKIGLRLNWQRRTPLD